MFFPIKINRNAFQLNVPSHHLILSRIPDYIYDLELIKFTLYKIDCKIRPELNLLQRLQV